MLRTLPDVFIMFIVTTLLLVGKVAEFQTAAAQDIIYPELHHEESACVTPVGAEGRCVRLDMCPALMNLFKARPLPPGVAALLRESGCGWVGNFPKVCCFLNNVKPFRKTSVNPVMLDVSSTTPLPNEAPSSVLEEVETLEDEERENNASIEDASSEVDEGQVIQHLGSGVADSLEADNEDTDTTENGVTSEEALPLSLICGFGSVGNRIFGGHDAPLGSHPWAAALAYGDSTKFTFQCGGALVNSWYVVTAAHCVKGSDGNLLNLAFIRLGDHNLFSDDDGAEPEDYQPDVITPHPNYTRSPEILYDIAVIRLKKKVDFSAFIGPVCLPAKSGPRIALTSQENSTVIGWGRNEVNITSPILQEVVIPVVPNSKCNDQYHAKNIPFNIYENQLCAGKQGKDSCSGDSGGPLTVRHNIQYYLQGVISFGTVYCDGRLPGVYTRITSFLDWLHENIIL